MKNQFKLPYFVVVSLMFGSPVFAQLSGSWAPEGPGPNTLGQVEAIDSGEVIGAINTVAPHPTDENILYIGAVNGGIWKTNNATATNPNWIPQLDEQATLSIAEMEFDPTDATFNTLVAGIGRSSSIGSRGGQRVGIYRTTNGGTDWTAIDGNGQLNGLNIKAIVARGNVIVIAVNFAESSGAARGVYRSDDTGNSWTQISVGDGTGATGLPSGVSFDLASDPSNNDRIYTNIVETNGNQGVFRSDDIGATWTRVSNAAIDTAIGTGSVNNLEISVGAADNPYIIIVDGGQTSAVFRSTNGGTSWAQMDLPVVGVLGIHPGGQGGTHLSITADLNNNNIIYVGGDRQDFGGNIIGATNFTGRLMRGDASQASGFQWVHLTHRNDLGPAGGGTANRSSPHADSRDMAMAANGVLIEGDDGGVYIRTNPLNNTGDWFSINGDIQTTEFHAARYDSVSGIIIGGAQDTGTPEQIQTANVRWRSVTTADGAVTSVDNLSLPNMSVRYSSTQFLGGWRRRVIDSNNVVQSTAFPVRTPLDGAPGLTAQFYTPIELNRVNPVRVIFGGSNGVYESLDQGDTVSLLDDNLIVPQASGDPIAYGASDNEDILYVGAGGGGGAMGLFIRTAAAPAPLVESTTFPGSGQFIRDIVIQPDNSTVAYVVTSDAVFQTTDTGTSWADITNNLTAFNPGTLRSVTYINNPVESAIVVGTQSGLYIALESQNFATWTDAGVGLPNTPIYAVEYIDSEDLLMVGTLGRGAWTLSPTFVFIDPDVVFSDGFEAN